MILDVSLIYQPIYQKPTVTHAARFCKGKNFVRLCHVSADEMSWFAGINEETEKSLGPENWLHRDQLTTVDLFYNL